MTWRDTFRTAFDAVRTHRLRSALTMLGILIGISAVVLTVGLGAGARAEVRDQIDALGTNLLVVSPGSVDRQHRHPRRLRHRVDADRPATPRRWRTPTSPPTSRRSPPVSTTIGVAGRRRRRTGRRTLTGTTESWQDDPVPRRHDGRFIDDDDERRRRRSWCSAPTPPTELFGDDRRRSARPSRYDGIQLEVVGVLEALELVERRLEHNDVAIVPLSHLCPAPGRRHRPRLGRASIYVKATVGDTLSAAYQEADTRCC